ncbi:MAG: TMEM14 family protein [Verrucomicrobiae bacterium]|nr:TMEM14 family protein [Verrucomicrobiae bacterium]
MQYTVLLVYIVLLLVGGLIGYFKGKSAVSLVMSAIFAAALIVCAVPGVLAESFSKNVANVLMAALLVVFGIRWAKTKKFMPAGLMLVLTVVALALRNINF